MTGHDFILKLNRETTDDEIEALYEAGCSDAGVETGPLGTVIDFTREAPSLAEAIVSAVRDIEKVQGLRAVGVACDNMVTLAQIAERAGVSREAVRLWATGQRRYGFPAPDFLTPAGEKVWDWPPVADWLLDHNPAEPMPVWTVSVRLRTLCTAHRVLVARAALEAEPDETREELETLLQDA